MPSPFNRMIAKEGTAVNRGLSCGQRGLSEDRWNLDGERSLRYNS